MPRGIICYVAVFYKIFNVLMVGGYRPDTGEPHQLRPADPKGFFGCIAVTVIEQGHQQADMGRIKSAFH
ncbi:hypothetical protein HMPREF0765_4610 [Sphingobacterium spiritivorum ATCC 33300]|uniref:Uncharacterized protein n=1 Tax=Sphingobacterium spiritivorum ATCC 33300 TaxID=525372 RepID=C2G4V4_SPHSI|nr:hypothetical protein HMPREF0765_4610 [Sphingobacterium spiritivorum ATCC 33300]